MYQAAALDVAIVFLRVFRVFGVFRVLALRQYWHWQKKGEPLA
jgi:hypothetical protein